MYNNSIIILQSANSFISLLLSPSPRNLVYRRPRCSMLQLKIFFTPVTSIAPADPEWFNLHTCDSFHSSYAVFSVFLKSLRTQALQYLLSTSTSKILPVSHEIAVKVPFNDENPLRCQEPSPEMSTSTISFSLLLGRNSPASFMDSSATW